MWRWLILCLIVLAYAPLAYADVQTYRELIDAAITAQESGHYQDARRLFVEAHTLYPNARSLRGMGVAAFQAGDYVQTIRDLEAALVHPEKPLDESLRASAGELLARARARVASITVDLTPADATVTLTVDEAQVRGDQDILLEPGPHVLLISSAGFQPQQLTLNAQAGVREVVRFTLVPIELPVVSVMHPSALPLTGGSLSPANPAGRPSGQRDDDRGSRIAMWSLLVTGGALSIATGGLAWAGWEKAQPIDRACREGCDASERNSQIEAAHLRELEMSVNIVGSAALASLLASGSVWLYRRVASRPSNDHPQQARSFGMPIRF